jgi:hypothetical protein
MPPLLRLGKRVLAMAFDMAGAFRVAGALGARLPLGALKKKLGLLIGSEKGDDGQRRYRIVS